MRYSQGVCNFIPSEALLYSTTTLAPTTVSITTQPPSLLEIDCHFEEPCVWTNARGNRFNWTVLTAEEAENISNYSPDYDHTTLTNQGSFLTTLDPALYATSYYLSPYVNGTKCLEFWYYLYGPQVGTLRISRSVTYSSGSISNGTLWNRTSSDDQNWKFAQISYTVTGRDKFLYRIEHVISGFSFNVCHKKFLIYWNRDLIR